MLMSAVLGNTNVVIQDCNLQGLEHGAKPIYDFKACMSLWVNRSLAL